MLSPLLNASYRHLFAAQVLSLLGTGLATVALGLLAFELAGGDAGVVLGTALFIKMIAYVGIAPIVGGFADRLPRKVFLVSLDLVRVVIALLLPFVDQVWQIYVLVFVLQSASAAFTPTFQATIPQILVDEREYTKALSLSRLAYDLESLLSPMLAAALLNLITFHWLFAGTALGFIASAVLVVSARLAIGLAAKRPASFIARSTRGLRIYLRTPRLRGLLAMNLTAAASGAFVIVNTVVVVRSVLSGSEADVAIALAFFGAGSMVVALALPQLLDRVAERKVMGTAAGTMAGIIFLTGIGSLATGINWYPLLGAWFVLGCCYSAILTPVGRLLRRSAHEDDRPALFAAQFALSHACWLVTYPLAGLLGRSFGMPWTMIAMGAIGWIGLTAGLYFWPRHDTAILEHTHDDLPQDHSHIRDAARIGGRWQHAHEYVIDDQHPAWPQ